MDCADRRGFGDAGTTDGGIFQIDRADPFATRLDHVFRAVGDLHRAVEMHDRDIAGVEPSVAVHRIGIRRKISTDHPGSPNA